MNWKTNETLPEIINNNTNNILPQRLIVYSKKHNYFGEAFYVEEQKYNNTIYSKRHVEKYGIYIDWENIDKWISVNELYQTVKDEL